MTSRGARGTLHPVELTLVGKPALWRARLVRHPSETAEHLVLRILVYALFPAAREPGAAPSEVCVGDAPAIGVDARPGGTLACWIDVGRMTAARLEHAARRAERVRVLAHRGPWLDALARAKLRAPVRIDLVQRAFVQDLAEALEAQPGRRIAWSVDALTPSRIRVEARGQTFDSALETLELGAR